MRDKSEPVAIAVGTFNSSGQNGAIIDGRNLDLEGAVLIATSGTITAGAVEITTTTGTPDSPGTYHNPGTVGMLNAANGGASFPAALSAKTAVRLLGQARVIRATANGSFTGSAFNVVLLCRKQRAVQEPA